MSGNPQPRLVTVIIRLAALEAADSPSPAQLRELNALRVELEEDWPEVGKALVTAYLGVAAGYHPN